MKLKSTIIIFFLFNIIILQKASSQNNSFEIVIIDTVIQNNGLFTIYIKGQSSLLVTKNKRIGKDLLKEIDKTVIINFDSIGDLLSYQKGNLIKTKVDSTVTNVELFSRLTSRILKTEIPEDTVVKLFSLMQSMSCDSLGCNGNIPCIPFQFTRTGCYARAHLIRKIIEDDYGFQVKKIFAKGFLNAKVNNRCGKGCQGWGYHVAVIVQELKKDGTKKEVVIDPAVSNFPLDKDKWIEAISYHVDPNNKIEVNVVDSKYYNLRTQNKSLMDMSIYNKDTLDGRTEDDYGYYDTKNFLSKHCSSCNEFWHKIKKCN